MVEIPNGVKATVTGYSVSVKGPLGEVHKTFSKDVSVSVKDNQVIISTQNPALEGTSQAMLKNMMKGVSSGFKSNFKLIYAHFPISIEVKGKDIVIKNFLGEKQARKTIIIGTTKVEAKGQNVTISGPDKEAVGQTIANMRTAMHIRDKDGRVFQDGMYEIEGE